MNRFALCDSLIEGESDEEGSNSPGLINGMSPVGTNQHTTDERYH